MIHACTAQAFLCLVLAISTALSPAWDAWKAFPLRATHRGISIIRALAWTLFGAVYCQLILGAIMRHLHAGLSIPTFPLAFGRLIPPMINERVEIHFAHRAGALVVTLLILALTAAIFAFARNYKRLTWGAAGIVAALILQIYLAFWILRSGRDPVITSLHVVNGALILGKALLMAMRATKLGALLQPEPTHWTPYQEAHA
jgi:cytochrome c oxidase assembly protein subunit 15